VFCTVDLSSVLASYSHQRCAEVLGWRRGPMTMCSAMTRAWVRATQAVLHLMWGRHTFLSSAMRARQRRQGADSQSDLPMHVTEEITCCGG
jgi:hypothetical protein